MFTDFLRFMVLLEKHQIPALFYITTSTIDTSNELWWDYLERVTLQADTEKSLVVNLKGEEIEVNYNSPEARQRSYEALLPPLRRLPFPERQTIMDKLANHAGNPEPRQSHRCMSWDELRKMTASEYVVIGAHTENHCSVGALDYETQFAEIKTSKDKLEAELSKEMIHFSYPFGTTRDYNQDSIKVVKELGFKMVCANFPDLANKTSSIWEVPRFLVRDWERQEFEANLKQSFQG